MWSDVVVATNWGLVWLLVIWVAFWRAFSAKAKERIYSNVPGWLVCGILLVVRVVPALLLPVGAGYDIESFRLVGEAVLNGQEVYTSAAIWRHPYLPMYMYVIGAALYVANSFSLPFVVLVKLPAIAADVGITAVLYHASHQSGKSPAESKWIALLYALNPISVLVSSYHGQFDPVSIFLLMLAWYSWQWQQKEKTSAFILGLAVLNKTWPIVLLPLLLLRLKTYYQQIIYAVITLAVPITAVLTYLWVYQADPAPMLLRALTHTGPPGYWGLSALLAVAAKLGNTTAQTIYDALLVANRWLILVAGLAAWWITRRQSLVDALVTTILTIFVISSGMGIQWLVWVAPFAMLVGDFKWLKWYSLAGTVFLVGQLYGLHLYPWATVFWEAETADIFIRLTSIPAWIVVIVWAIHRRKSAAFTPNSNSFLKENLL